MDFWGRVTPGALQLLSHSKVHSEMVNLHILSLMEALQDVNSPVLAKLFPMWTPILYSHHKQVFIQFCLQIQGFLHANEAYNNFSATWPYASTFANVSKLGT